MIANVNEFGSQYGNKKERRAYSNTQFPCNLIEDGNHNMSQNPNQVSNQKPFNFTKILVSYTELLP